MFKYTRADEIKHLLVFVTHVSVGFFRNVFATGFIHDEHGCLTGTGLRFISPERMIKNLKNDICDWYAFFCFKHKEKHCLASTSPKIFDF